MLHSLSPNLASCVVSFLCQYDFARAALISRHEYATISRTRFPSLVWVPWSSAFRTDVPPNFGRCWLVGIHTLPISPAIEKRWRVEALDLVHFNQPLEPGVFPAGLICLRLGTDFDQPLSPGVLPEGLEEINLGSRFNQPLVAGVFPKSLRRVRLPGSFDQPLEPGVLPAGLVELELGIDFNQPLAPGALPASLRKLLLWDTYAQPLAVNVLPPGCCVCRHPNWRFE